MAVSISSDVVAELWEYQRCATTCANAYRAAADGTLPRATATRAARARLSRRTLHDALGRRPAVAGDGARVPDPHAGKRPGRRRPRHRVLRRRRGQGRRDLLRHGRHHGESLPDRERPRRDRADDGGGARAPLQERLGPADQGAGDRHDRDRRRRRLDRRDRRGGAAARRPAFCRRRSGPRLLRRAAAPNRP